LGQGVTAAAIKADEVRKISDLNVDANHAPWQGRFSGFSSGLACPLRVGNEVIGALTIYDREPNTFGDDEVALLTEFSDDLAFGIATLRTRAEQTRTQAAMDHMVRHDALTGLPNAFGFSEAVSAVIIRQDGRQSPQQWAAMLFNIKRLGEINDVLGFSFGDQILR
ncbi:sensor domain-containing diguanylate cyclase, partial [Leptospira sp. SA-E8]|uniref:sensor domain-containing diguanylate cyclase n=1 Tax=Leptospira sp. SA-E8 TaxID=3422259 RepID=UPI003EB941AF